MKSLIIGGTSGLGKYLSEELISRGAEIITISRSDEGFLNNQHFKCDVLDKNKLEQIVTKISNENNIIDNVWCVAGYAFPKKVEEQTQEVYQIHLDRNFTYVQLVLNNVLGNIRRSDDPRVITFGSQWSYRSKYDFLELAPYAEAKKKLMKYTQIFAIDNPEIKANHYCIPTTHTPAMIKIKETLSEINKKLLTSHEKLADPGIVINRLVEHALNFSDSGETMVWEVNWTINVLK